MPTIVSFTLIRLRKAKGWSLEQLGKWAKINKQTIWRLENEHTTTVHENTLQKLAHALGVEPAVLTGKAAVPEPDDDSAWSQLAKLNFRISTSAHNALYLVADRYDVTHQEIVELAPFLFCWAAQASLRQRKERLEQAERAYENALHLEREMRHLRGSGSNSSKERFVAESKSIDSGDLFGLSLDDEGFGQMNQDIDNPFAIFLDSLVEDIEGGATFDGYGMREHPFYRICEENAARLAGGDSELTEDILEGRVVLNEMPKFGRVEWLRTKAEEFRKKLHARAEEITEASS
jgi:transcriptional regulator with XRE-family HTH domain